MKAKIIKTGEIVEVYHETQHGQTTNIYKEAVLVNGRMWTEDELDFSINSKLKEGDLEKEIKRVFDDEFFKDPVFGKLVNRNAGICIAKYFFELGLKAKDWKKERMEECPYRQVGCTMYEGKILECNGACSWVVDYPKLKELKAQKGE